jgi:hypothetical protein
MGYLFVIWDFGLIKPFDNNNKFYSGPLKSNFSNADADYSRVIRMIKKPEALAIFTPEFTPLINNLLKVLDNNKYTKKATYNLIKKLEQELLNIMVDMIPSFTTNKPSHIINKKPYTI